jgi:hypothetical protein
MATHRKTKSQRDTYLRRTYGITEAEYEAILKEQKGVCWICGKPPKKRRLHVDHKHVLRDKKQPPEETRKRVRGLLCWSCNGAIAKFRDDVAKLRTAADYCEQWPAQRILKEKK